jgi:integral membrane protein
MKVNVIKSRLKHLRLVSVMEGWSFLILLGIAMPLKYFADFPMAVKVVGWAHGVLFVWFMAALLMLQLVLKKNIFWLAKAAIASLIPFGPFLLEKSLKKEEEKLEEMAKVKA